MKLRLFLVLVVVYIVAVFGWWLYSFVLYTEKEFQLQYNNLGLNARVIQFELVEFLDKRVHKVRLKPYQAYEQYEKEIRNLHEQLNHQYKIKTNLSIRDSNSLLHELMVVEVDKREYRTIRKNFVRGQRAFYSEVIFFTILVISGVVWVFGKLESLLNLNKMQNNFLLSVTHEFKTPLTAIKLSAQTLEHRKMDESMKAILISQMVNNSDRLNELLDNVLLATRIDGRSYKFDMKELDITSLIEKSAALQLVQPHFHGTFDFNEEEMMVHGDEVSLRLVFSNIFQNAIKYAGPESHITVNYTYIDNELQIRIADDGKGLNPKEYKAIFKKFYRVGDENTRETKGTGLGLFLVKQILKSHRATITAESNKPRGTAFIITFKRTKL